MSGTARVSIDRIVHVLDAIPNYREYRRDEVAAERETSYRLALGRAVKAWGDLLLDLADQQPRTLSRVQAGMVDTLLEGIGEVFHTLNEVQELRSVGGVETESALVECDLQLLQLLEQAHLLVNRLRQREFSGVWLEENAKPLYRTLRRMERVLQSRNDALGMQVAPDVPQPSGGITPQP